MRDTELQLEAVLEMVKKIKKSLEAPPRPRLPCTDMLGLPFELRLHIYHYVIPRRRIVEVSWPRLGIESEPACHNLLAELGVDGFEDAPDDEATCLSWEDDFMPEEDILSPWGRRDDSAIFRISKQISNEALDIFYGDNIFVVRIHGQGEYDLKHTFTEANRRRMRYLLLVAEPQGISYEPGRMPDSALWSSILPTLKELRLVARQPIESAAYYNAPTLEEDMQRWVQWVKPFLRCFGRYLSTDTVVSVDVDGHAETRDLVKRNIPHGYRETQCHVLGDLIFKRGRFSWESGYWDEDEHINSRDGEWGYDSD